LTRQVTNGNGIFTLHVLAGPETNGNRASLAMDFTSQRTNGN
jgi:hypothetical protein